MFDFRISVPVIIIFLMSCCFPLFPQLVDVNGIATAVRSIENSQAVLLFVFGIFTLIYMRPWDMPNGQKQFWFWAACWWLMLFGRSISWGRDYFPEVPKIYFRAISIVLIGSVVFYLFSPHLRAEIAKKFKTIRIPVWPFALAFAGLFIADSIEHTRFVDTLLVKDMNYHSFMEELYEYTLVFGLGLTAWYFMKQDKLESKKSS